jgi:hypothetical protein
MKENGKSRKLRKKAMRKKMGNQPKIDPVESGGTPVKKGVMISTKLFF